MNKLLRDSFRWNNWSRLEGLLAYMRATGCFVNGFTNRPDANPYWYGSVLDFQQAQKVIEELLQSKSIKPSRLIELAGYAEREQYLSPIVSLTGKTIKRIVEKHLDKFCAIC